MRKIIFKGIGVIFCLMLSLMIMPLSDAKAGSGDVAINETNFPDSNFRDYIQNVDINENGKLSESEIEAVKEINVFNLKN